MVLMSVEFSPLFRGKLAWIVCVALIVVFGVEATTGSLGPDRPYRLGA